MGKMMTCPYCKTTDRPIRESFPIGAVALGIVLAPLTAGMSLAYTSIKLVIWVLTRPYCNNCGFVYSLIGWNATHIDESSLPNKYRRSDVKRRGKKYNVNQSGFFKHS